MPLIVWLRSALRHLSPRARAIALVALLLGAAVLALAPTQRAGHRAQRPSARAATSRTTRRARQHESPGFGGAVARARQVARTFLAGYLPLVYGRASAAPVRAATPALRRRLRSDHAQVTPVERSRRPRVVSLTTVGQPRGIVVAAALIGDGGVANYSLRLTVRRTSRGWLVSRVDGG